MYKTTLAELEAIKTEYKIVPVSKEIFADLTTPIKVLKILKNISDNVYLFESVENTHHWGRYSFLGFNPSLEISCKNHLLKIKKLVVMKYKKLRQIIQIQRLERF